MEKALYPDFLEYPRLEYYIGTRTFFLGDELILSDGDSMEVAIYDYKSDCFKWVPVVYHVLSEDWLGQPEDFSFEGLPYYCFADGLHVRNFHRE